MPRFYAITILIAGKIYDFVVLLAQGLVVLYLFACAVSVHQSKRVVKAAQTPMQSANIRFSDV